MSIPRRHHYVPRVHIRRFKTENGYHLFSKDKKEFINIKSSAHFFVIRDLNSTIDFETGEVNHIQTEKELAQAWDSKFNEHCYRIMKYISFSLEEKAEYPELIKDSLAFFFDYGVIGALRSIKRDKELNENAFDWIDVLDEMKAVAETERFADKIKMDKNDFEQGFSHWKNVMGQAKEYASKLKTLKFPFPTTTNADIFKPSSCSCDIILAPGSSFILPDRTAVLKPSHETFKYHSMTMNKISCVGIPLTPKIFLQIKNNDVCEDQSTTIYALTPKRVAEFNLKLYNKARNQILCSDKNALTTLIEN